ncbi:MAG: hypothetical protein WC869_01160 [Phycisphaerae bacterium]|jgi:hypothetical protein
MRITEIADLLHLELQVEGTCFPSQNYRVSWTAQFKDVEIKNGQILTSCYGSGSTPRAAITSYIKEITGKQLVHNANCHLRKMFKVPAGTKP